VTWQFTLTGLLIGVLVGLTGMGGGALLTPILVILFGFKPTYAVGTDILHGAIFKTFGAVRHRRLGTVHARLTFWMFLGSGPMSLLGVVVASRLDDAYGDGLQSAEAYAIGGALVLGAAGLVAKTFIKRGVQPNDAPFILERKDRVRAILIGAVFGFIVGLTSVGSGTFFGLVMVMVYPLTVSKIVGRTSFTPPRCSGWPGSAISRRETSTCVRCPGSCSDPFRASGSPVGSRFDYPTMRSVLRWQEFSR
jgi:uncharacterized protein